MMKAKTIIISASLRINKTENPRKLIYIYNNDDNY